MADARLTVAQALFQMKAEDGYSNIVIDKVLSESELDSRDKAFASALFYGTIERRLTLDYIAKRYLRPKIRIKPAVRIILRIGLYQLAFMDKVPDSATVNESVKLTYAMGQSGASGLVNAVLRAFLRDDKKIEYPTDTVDRLSVQYSCDKTLVAEMINDYGEQTAEQILSAFCESENKITIRVNTTRTTAKELAEKLIEKGVTVEQDKFCENALHLTHAGDVRSLYGYKNGLFHVQDTASQLCAKSLEIGKNMRVLDVCAAPGGKTFTIAEMLENGGEVVACDKYEHKIKMISSGAYRLRLKNVTTLLNDASKYNYTLEKFDRVLCDLPCSGSGIMAKKPEIRYKNVGLLDNLPHLQYDLLVQSSNYVQKGGVLVYSTCSIRKAENKAVAERFLSENSDYEPYPILADIPRAIDEPSNMLTLLPHVHNTDGFFISAFKRKCK